MEVEKIAVIGAGNMGHGIARTCAVHGFEVLMTDKNHKAVESGVKMIEEELKKYFVGKGRMTQDQSFEVLKRLHGVTGLADAVGEADLAIESVSEDLEIKESVFSELDRLCPTHTILASNTSYLSITGLGSVTQRPDKVIGMHFFNPPDVNPLVEVAPGLLTSEETVGVVLALAEKMGKQPMRVKDTPGYVVNRFINVIYPEAARTVQSGIATAEQIDFGVKMGLGFRLGPCEMMDYTGLDHLALRMSHEPRFSDIYLLQKMADAGRYGRKNGKGFYDYHKDGTRTLADLSNIAGK
jgi:3-hydroxybutyryl-CoA dehydrogenase